MVVKTVLVQIINLPNCSNCTVLPEEFKYYSFNSQSFTHGVYTGFLQSRNIFIVRLDYGCHAFDSVSLGAHGAYSLAEIMHWEVYSDDARRLYLAVKKQKQQQQEDLIATRNILELQNDGTFTFGGGLSEEDYIRSRITLLEEEHYPYYYCPNFNTLCTARVVYLSANHEEKLKLYIMESLGDSEKLTLYEKSFNFAKQLCCPYSSFTDFLEVFSNSLRKLLNQTSYEEGFNYLFIRPFISRFQREEEPNNDEEQRRSQAVEEEEDKSLKLLIDERKEQPTNIVPFSNQILPCGSPELLVNLAICQETFFTGGSFQVEDHQHPGGDDDDIYATLSASVGHPHDDDDSLPKRNIFGNRINAVSQDGLPFDYVVQIFLIPPNREGDSPTLFLEIFAKSEEGDGEFMSRIHRSSRQPTFFF